MVDPRRRRGGRRAGHDPGPARGALRHHAGRGDAVAGHLLRDAGRAVPGVRPDHRLHRRGADAVPVRADADRRQFRRLTRRDDQGPAAGHGPAGDRPVRAAGRGHRARRPRPASRGRTAAERDEQPDRDRDADLHHLCVPVRSHRCAADHRRAGRDGAGAPRADHTEADPAGPGREADRQRTRGTGPVTRRLRAARRGGQAGLAPGRHDLRSFGEHRAVPARRDRGNHQFVPAHHRVAITAESEERELAQAREADS